MASRASPEVSMSVASRGAHPPHAAAVAQRHQAGERCARPGRNGREAEAAAGGGRRQQYVPRAARPQILRRRDAPRQPGDVGQRAGEADALGHPADDVARHHRQSVAGRRRLARGVPRRAPPRDGTADALRIAAPSRTGNAATSETCTVVVCPTSACGKTAGGGLTRRIRGINARPCCDAAANTCRKADV